ncbi:MAG: TetR/AcrR family transcriptional regulator [Xanthobacteraceae bacterium]
MAYRHTDAVARKLAARREAILLAANEIAATGGMAALQIAPVAERAGVATGTVYRYFASKTELVAALTSFLAEREVAALVRAALAAPGPLSGLATAMCTLAARALTTPRLIRSFTSEPVEPEVEVARSAFRASLAAAFEKLITAALRSGYLPPQDPRLAAAALIGALVEGLIGPLAPSAGDDGPIGRRERIQDLVLLALRALGVPDARARGLVVQAVQGVILA